MELVSNIHERRWADESLDGARGYASVEIVAGERHSLRNVGDADMMILTVSDPPRVRDRAELRRQAGFA